MKNRRNKKIVTMIAGVLAITLTGYSQPVQAEEMTIVQKRNVRLLEVLSEKKIERDEVLGQSNKDEREFNQRIDKLHERGRFFYDRAVLSKSLLSEIDWDTAVREYNQFRLYGEQAKKDKSLNQSNWRVKIASLNKDISILEVEEKLINLVQKIAEETGRDIVSLTDTANRMYRSFSSDYTTKNEKRLSEMLGADFTTDEVEVIDGR